MADLVRVRFIHSHGSYNPGEIAGVTAVIAQKLCSGKRPVAVLASEADLKAPQAGLEAALDALPENLRTALQERFAGEVQAARKPLLAELDQVRAEAAPLASRIAETSAENEKLKARVAELEGLLAKASEAHGKGKGGK